LYSVAPQEATGHSKTPPVPCPRPFLTHSMETMTCGGRRIFYCILANASNGPTLPLAIANCRFHMRNTLKIPECPQVRLGDVFRPKARQHGSSNPSRWLFFPGAPHFAPKPVDNSPTLLLALTKPETRFVTPHPLLLSRILSFLCLLLLRRTPAVFQLLLLARYLCDSHFYTVPHPLARPCRGQVNLFVFYHVYAHRVNS
jgi:hypothetical protein